MNYKRLVRTLVLTFTVIGVLVALIVLATKDSANVDSNSSMVREVPHVFTPEPGLVPLTHVFSKGVITLCGYTPGHQSAVKFDLKEGRILKDNREKPILSKPGQRLVSTDGKVVEDDSPEARYRWCAAYEAPTVKEKVWEVVRLRVNGTTYDMERIRILPDQF